MGENNVNSKNIPLQEIDEKVIENIREVNPNSTEYKKLKYALEKDGQIHPITVRILTEDERNAAENKSAVYGIIDGHHRFSIAKELNQETILATEVERSELEQEYHDKVLAYRLNESSIKMTPIEKGHVIYDLIKNNKKSPREVEKVGEEVFGLKKSMSYFAVNTYKKSIGENTVRKPRDSKFNAETLQNLLNKIPKNIPEISTDENIKKEQLDALKALQVQLKYLKILIETNQN